MANYMAEVAKMLGVELEEEFEIPEYSSYKFKITTSGIQVCIDHLWKANMPTASCALEKLLEGIYIIKRKPWKPKDRDAYFYVDKNGDVYTNTCLKKMILFRNI